MPALQRSLSCLSCTAFFLPSPRLSITSGDLYKVKVQHNVEKWNRTGLAGYVVCGSTGESVYLTTEEKLQMWEWVAEYAASDKILVCGTGVESVRETVALTNAAAELRLQGRHGADAALLQEPGATRWTRRCCTSARWPTRPRSR